MDPIGEETITKNRCLLRCPSEKGLASHRFPTKNPYLMAKWVAAIGGKHMITMKEPYLCTRHFEKKYLNLRGGKYRLHRHALPTIFDDLPREPTRKKKANRPIIQSPTQQINPTIEQKETPNYNYFNPNDICRACFTTKSDKFHSLFGSANLLEIYRRCSQLKVELNDGLPTKLCSNCVLKCFSWFNFYKLCSQTETLVKKLNQNKNQGVDGRKCIPNNNSKESSIVISEDEDNENYIIYTDESCDMDIDQNTTDKAETIDNNDEQEIKQVFCLPSFTDNYTGDEKKCDLIVDNNVDVDDSLKFLSCNVCGEQFIHKTMIKLHMDKFHPITYPQIKGKPYKCDLCNREYTKSSSFYEHKRRHAAEKEKSLAIEKEITLGVDSSVETSPVPVRFFTTPVTKKFTLIKIVETRNNKPITATVETTSASDDPVVVELVETSEYLAETSPVPDEISIELEDESASPVTTSASN